MFGQIVSAFAGKKTYIIVAFCVIGIFLENFGGIDLPMFTPSDNWVQDMLTILGLGTLRAGIAKTA